jgi:RNA recognition motif-containing protein
MTTKLFVGNIPYSATDEILQEKFSAIGTVVSASVVSDRETGRSRGFGFVEMSSDDEAQKAVAELNGADCEGRAMVVSEARPQGERQGGGDFGGGRPRRDNFSRGGGGGGGRGGFRRDY